MRYVKRNALGQRPGSFNRSEADSTLPSHGQRTLYWDYLPQLEPRLYPAAGTPRSSGLAFLTSKAIMAIVGAIVPEIYEIDGQERKFLMELVNKHEGRLTAEVFKGYRKLAQRMNQERIAHEKELKKLQGKQ